MTFAWVFYSLIRPEVKCSVSIHKTDESSFDNSVMDE